MSKDLKCPLCGAEAAFDEYDNGNILLYHCNSCTDYFISRSAAKWINKHEPHRKVHFSQIAASCKGKANILALTVVAGETLHSQEVSLDYFRITP